MATNSNLEKELWQTAVNLRGTVAPAEYKNYVLPLLFMRFLSLRYEQRYEQLALLLKDRRSHYYTGDPAVDREILEDPVEYESQNVFIVPDEARWSTLRRHARADDIKLRLDKAMRLLEESHPKLNGLLPPIYARSNLSNIQLEDLTSYVYGTLMADEQHKEDFLSDEYKLAKAFSLVRHLPEAQVRAEEVGFYQMVRKQLGKADPVTTQRTREMEGAVRDLLDESITAQPAVDIYAVAGLDKPDVSILDGKFLAGHGQNERKEDLQVRLLAKLLADEIEARRRKNIVRYRSYKEMLEEALRKYNNRAITAQDVVAVMREIRSQQRAEAKRQAELGLNDEELAFYDVIVLGEGIELHQTDEWIADLVRQVVEAVRANLEVDWTKPHRSSVAAVVQSAVGLVLRRNRIKGEQFRFLRERLMKQAEATYARWPEVA